MGKTADTIGTIIRWTLAGIWYLWWAIVILLLVGGLIGLAIERRENSRRQSQRAELPILKENVGECSFGYRAEGGGATIVSIAFKPTDKVVIPDKLGGLPVVKIGDCALDLGARDLWLDMPMLELIRHHDNYRNFNWVVLPASLVEIGSGVFSGCTRLRDVEFPASLRKIGDSAFSGCEHLVTLDFPEGLVSIGMSSFEGCVRLRSVKFPKSLHSIGAGAFLDCEDLEDAPLPEGLLDISHYAFAGCPLLVPSGIPSSVTNVGALVKYAMEASEDPPPSFELSTLSHFRDVQSDEVRRAFLRLIDERRAIANGGRKRESPHPRQ